MTWVQVTAAAPFAPRDAFSWAAASTGGMVIFGGSVLNGYGGYLGDLWYSGDDGASWKLITAQSSIGNYSLTSMIFDAAGYLYLFGGQSERLFNGTLNQYDWLSVSAVSTAPISAWAPSSGTAPASSTAVAPITSSTGGAVSSSGFNFQLYGTQWAESDAFEVVLPVVLNANYSGSITSIPAGEIYIFGASFGEAVLPTYNPSVGTVNVSTQGLGFSTTAYGGNSGCANRAGSTRFYLIGTSVAPGASTATNDTYYVFASSDGVNWANVLDAATTQLWYSRFDDDNTMCVVDLLGNVYDIGSGTTWKSSNAGVTWVNLNNNPATRFSNRIYFAGGIFTSQLTGADKMMVIGGRVVPGAGNYYNGGSDLNDVSRLLTTPHTSIALIPHYTSCTHTRPHVCTSCADIQCERRVCVCVCVCV